MVQIKATNEKFFQPAFIPCSIANFMLNTLSYQLFSRKLQVNIKSTPHHNVTYLGFFYRLYLNKD